jgi:hypothetical protein
MIAGQITPQMIEAGAMALRDQFANRCRLLRKTKPWDALPPKLQDDYRAEASAALSAALAVAQIPR